LRSWSQNRANPFFEVDRLLADVEMASGILWTAETADNSYEFATDTFVVRNGKIVVQSFAAKIKRKR
jgi:hypothetical protein